MLILGHNPLYLLRTLSHLLHIWSKERNDKLTSKSIYCIIFVYSNDMDKKIK